jgi:hypothetical protein
MSTFGNDLIERLRTSLVDVQPQNQLGENHNDSQTPTAERACHRAQEYPDQGGLVPVTPPMIASCCILALILSRFSDRRPGKFRLSFRFAMIPSIPRFRSEELCVKVS